MANFNTYQTRQLYVAKKVESTLAGVDEAGDIYVGSVPADGTVEGARIFFTYCNADGLVTRSDTIPASNIVSLKKTAAADMDTPLMKYTIAVDSDVTLSNYVGKALDLTIFMRQFLSYDPSDSISMVASVLCTSTNTATTAAFNKALAKAIVKAMPALPEPPFKVFIGSTEITKDLADGSYPGSGDLNVVQAAGKYIRGKISKEALELTFESHTHSSNTDDIPWAVVTPAVSNISGNTAIPSVYAISDLEYFALGERGDVYRGSAWPNDYEPTYLVDLTKKYDMVSVEFYWQGSAENVQKSPRMIQIACEVSGSGSQATSAADTLYDAIAAAMAGVASS